MSKLIILENGLVPFYKGKKESEKLINARELHDFLKVGKVFAAWIRDRIEKHEYIEGKEYFLKLEKIMMMGRPRKEYLLTIQTAKEIALAEDNKRGREVRRYFIEIENKYREQNNLPQMDIAELKRVAEGQSQILKNQDELNRKLDKVMKQMSLIMIPSKEKTTQSSTSIKSPKSPKKQISKGQKTETRNLIHNKVLQLASMKGIKTGQIYADVYETIHEMHGIDIQKRLEVKRNQLNNKRLKRGKNPYTKSSLKGKVNGMDLVMMYKLDNEVVNILSKMITDQEKVLAAM